MSRKQFQWPVFKHIGLHLEISVFWTSYMLTWSIVPNEVPAKNGSRLPNFLVRDCIQRTPQCVYQRLKLNTTSDRCIITTSDWTNDGDRHNGSSSWSQACINNRRTSSQETQDIRPPNLLRNARCDRCSRAFHEERWKIRSRATGGMASFDGERMLHPGRIIVAKD